MEACAGRVKHSGSSLWPKQAWGTAVCTGPNVAVRTALCWLICIDMVTGPKT